MCQEEIDLSSLELEDYARQIDSVNAEARALVDAHTPSDLMRPAPDGGWSVAECLDHVATTVEKYLPAIRAALEEGRANGVTGVGPFHYGFLARTFLWILEPPVRMRVKAPGAFKPRPQPDPAAALAAYLTQHAELQKVLLLADGLDLAAIRVTSPASERLKLPAGAVIGILTAHARRHLWQARRALNAS
jgi:hypothetical protein